MPPCRVVEHGPQRVRGGGDGEDAGQVPHLWRGPMRPSATAGQTVPTGAAAAPASLGPGCEQAATATSRDAWPGASFGRWFQGVCSILIDPSARAAVIVAAVFKSATSPWSRSVPWMWQR
jgi:hypothetical protein